MIPFEELEGVEAKLSINSFYVPRDLLWRAMFVKIDALRKAEKEVQNEFVRVVNDAHKEQQLCYYLNMAGHLCRGYIKSFNPCSDKNVMGSYGSLMMKDADHSVNHPSPFDMYPISYTDLMMIESGAEQPSHIFPDGTKVYDSDDLQ